MQKPHTTAWLVSESCAQVPLENLCHEFIPPIPSWSIMVFCDLTFCFGQTSFFLSALTPTAAIPPTCSSHRILALYFFVPLFGKSLYCFDAFFSPLDLASPCLAYFSLVIWIKSLFLKSWKSQLPEPPNVDSDFNGGSISYNILHSALCTWASLNCLGAESRMREKMFYSPIVHVHTELLRCREQDAGCYSPPLNFHTC